MLSISNKCCCVKIRLTLVALFFFLDFASVVAQKDSVRYLNEVKVKGTRMPETAPMGSIQTLNSASLNKINALQLSDAVKHFAGVTVKDYGGVGGLKTISVRGLGANHTAFNYDGVTVTDSQSGQIDLSKFSLTNVEQVSLANGSPETILNPARAFASGSILSLTSVTPAFSGEQKLKTSATVKAGSFGLIAPSLLFQHKIKQNIAHSFLMEGQFANGKYPYVLDYGGTTSHEKRQNSDVAIVHLEENVFLTSRNNAKLFSKVYYYQSERGLPGATIYYNPYSSQRLWEKNMFIQSRYEKILSRRIETLVNVKYSSSYLQYLDPDYLGSAGKIENIYRQQEAYLSAAGVWKSLRGLQFSLAMDGFYNTLQANLYQFAYPSRLTWLTALNGKWKNDYVNVQLGAITTVVSEQVESGVAPNGQTKLSPSIIIGYQPLGSDKLSFRFFYKDMFRMPTFNDLYYTGVGNRSLRPENAHQFNLGMSYTVATDKKSRYVSGSIDIYHNEVKDKIMALPTKNIFIWSMLNVGAVNINGSDLAVKMGQAINSAVSISIEGTYTYQNVLDVTDREGKTYNNQIAYTPVHSGSGVVSMHTSIVDVSYNVIFSGQRYVLNHNIPTNLLKGYSEHGFTLSKEFTLHNTIARMSFEMLNAFNKQYEFVKNFPMPGRSFRITTSIKF